jgi:hypothetical protein
MADLYYLKVFDFFAYLCFVDSLRAKPSPKAL